MIPKPAFFEFKISFLYFIPLLILIIFITNFSVNVPYWDEWNIVDLFEKISTREAGIKDFFAQNNEHRLAFPLLIISPLAFLSKWDIRYELYFSVFLAFITFLAIFKLSSLHTNNYNNSNRLADILSCILIFSLGQYGNWLWGFQLAWFLVNSCFVIAILIIALSENYPKRFYFAAIPCFIASFSSAHGLLTWLAVIPAIASISGSYKNRIIRIVLWFLLFVGTCSLYFTDYQKPNHKVNTLFFFNEPLVAGKYFFTLLGTPLIHKAIISPAVGLIIFLIFLVLTVRSLKIHKFRFEINPQAAPWISIGLFAILFAVITTVGRASLGVDQAMSSRYTTPSVLLIISTAYLWRLFSVKNVFIAGIITGFILINSADVIPQAGLLQLYRQVSTTCLELINFIEESPDSCLSELYPSTKRLKHLAGVLERVGFRNFPQDVAFITHPTQVHGFIDPPTIEGNSCTLSKSKSIDVVGWTVRPDGHIELPPTQGPPCTSGKSGSVNVAGWAILPDSQELPKTVWFSYGTNKSFFANAVVNIDSPDVARALNSHRYSKVRWSVNISSKFLPLGETVIKAWVYNPFDKQFIQLSGEPKVKVVE